MYWDNNPSRYNLIVHPDPYMFLKYDEYTIYYAICTEDHLVKWEDKEEKVYFKGGLSGYVPPDEDGGNLVGRVKLIGMGVEHPDMIEAHYVVWDDDPKPFPEKKLTKS